MSLTLFNDAEPTQPRPPPAAAPQALPSSTDYAEDVDPAAADNAYYDVIERWFSGPARPLRPELASAHYWLERELTAETPERKAECHHYMILSLLALERSGKVDP